MFDFNEMMPGMQELLENSLMESGYNIEEAV